jgi:hypothetical protein
MHKFHLTIDTTCGDTSPVKRYLTESGLVDHFENDLSDEVDSGEENIIAIVRNKNKFFSYINRKPSADDSGTRSLILNCSYMGKSYKRKTPRRIKKIIHQMGTRSPF